MALTGYVVVETVATDVSPLNPQYHGIDRTPPWWPDRFPRGFDDPYRSDDYIDEYGLIATLATARDALAKYAAVVSDEFEIIQVFEVLDGDETPPALVASSFGFDVAERQFHFCSQLLGYPPEEWGQEYLHLLNQYGLFESAADARRFMERCIREEVPDLRPDWVTVWLVNPVTNR